MSHNGKLLVDDCKKKRAGYMDSEIEKHIVKHRPSHLVFEIIDLEFLSSG